MQHRAGANLLQGALTGPALLNAAVNDLRWKLRHCLRRQRGLIPIEMQEPQIGVCRLGADDSAGEQHADRQRPRDAYHSGAGFPAHTQ